MLGSRLKKKKKLVQGKFYTLGAEIELLIKADLGSRFMLGQGLSNAVFIIPLQAE